MAVKMKKSTKPKPPPAGGVLPPVSDEPPPPLEEFAFMVYGAKQIGKTTLGIQFPDPYLLQLEPTKGLRCKRSTVKTWDDAVEILEALEASPGYCRSVILDTVDQLYELAFRAVCEDAGCEHPTQMNDYGQTWKRVRREFRTYLTRLINLDVCVVLLSHTTEKEVEQYNAILGTSRKMERTQPTLTGQAMEEVSGVVDVTAFYGYVGPERFLVLRGDESLLAGARPQENFLTKSGEPVRSIHCGASPAETFGNLSAAFDNKQEEADPAGAYGREIEERRAASVLKKEAKK